MEREPRTRDALINAAINMFQQNGFQMTRVSDIVAAAGVAQGTFYNYFRSKEAIFREICMDFMEQVRERFVERTEHMFDGDTSDEVRHNVHRVIQDVFAIYQENLAVAELLFREGIGNGGLFKEIYEDILSLFLDLIREQIEKGIKKGFLRIRDAETAAVFLFGLFERTLFYFLLVRKNVNMETLENELADFMLRGLAFQEAF
ncbi:MAG TPA: TetR/AcrR family transcriptional regulator [Desulfosalsimonadaceae bacterium]|nr:TetR/AcrR family transcriptional regulator [Desulfosalsimonadaceae bacterium]